MAGDQATLACRADAGVGVDAASFLWNVDSDKAILQSPRKQGILHHWVPSCILSVIHGPPVTGPTVSSRRRAEVSPLPQEEAPLFVLGEPWKAAGADVCAVFCWTAGLAREGGVGADGGAYGGEESPAMRERARGAGGAGRRGPPGRGPSFLRQEAWLTLLVPHACPSPWLSPRRKRPNAGRWRKQVVTSWRVIEEPSGHLLPKACA